MLPALKRMFTPPYCSLRFYRREMGFFCLKYVVMYIFVTTIYYIDKYFVNCL